MSLYDGYATPIGQYASRLEADWASEFRCLGWPVKYVGDQLRHMDFILNPDRKDYEPISVEIKPENDGPASLDSFVIQAVMRFQDAGLSEAFLLCGRPRGPYTHWHYWRPNSLKNLCLDEVAVWQEMQKDRYARLQEQSTQLSTGDPFDPANLWYDPVSARFDEQERNREFLSRLLARLRKDLNRR